MDAQERKNSMNFSPASGQFSMLRANYLIRKITTRPVWWWEKNRPYPVRNRWRALPPLTTQKQASCTLLILTTEETLDQAVWAAWSWAVLLGAEFRFLIAVDGHVPERFRMMVERVLPQVEVQPADKLAGAFAGRSPVLSDFCRNSPLGRKLCLIAALQEETNLLYIDSDVLLFNYPKHLMQCVDRRQNCYNQEYTHVAYESSVLDAGKRFGLDFCEKLNSGLMFLRQGTLGLGLMISLLSRCRPFFKVAFLEQTLFAFLMQKADAIALPQELYVVSTCRQFWWQEDINFKHIHTRHFTGPVRHLMYLKGMPHVFHHAVQKYRQYAH